ILREYVTVNRATVSGGGVTTIGHHNFLMAYVHVAHDCHLGSHLIMANAATLAGHITIGDHAIIGGLVGIHQHVRVGAYAMIGGCSGVGKDVPPFMRAAGGYRARLYGLNSIGLKRHRLPPESASGSSPGMDGFRSSSRRMRRDWGITCQRSLISERLRPSLNGTSIASTGSRSGSSIN